MLQENGAVGAEDGPIRVLQYPFAVNEKVVIKVSYIFLLSVISHFHVHGNLEHVILYNTGKHENAREIRGEGSNYHITVSQWLVSVTKPTKSIYYRGRQPTSFLFLLCINRYLLKIIGSGEDVRLQYRSLRKTSSSGTSEERSASQSARNGSS